MNYGTVVWALARTSFPRVAAEATTTTGPFATANSCLYDP
jgi:hypothetical protein